MQNTWTTSTLPRSTPEAQGVACAALADFMRSADQQIEHLHSFMLLRHGAVVAEHWWHPYRPEAPHMLFSLSKSFTSSAIGLAVAEGLLDLDDPVVEFFPHDAPRRTSRNLAAMQVRHLLSMSTGHDQDTSEVVFPAHNPFKTFLALPVEHVPGTHFVYNSAASFLLAGIVQKLTGQTLVDYLTPRLFEPLGIPRPEWDSHPNGVAFGGFGLYLKTEEIARFGQLYLQKGVWQGQQLLPAEWVEQASAKQVKNGPDSNPDWAQGYGYQFWRCQPPGVYRGDGAFGQFCIILPEQDAVIAITAGVAEMQPVLSLCWEKLLPAFQPAEPPADPAGALALAEATKELRLSPPQGSPMPGSAAQLSGKTWAFPPNLLALGELRFDFEADLLEYQVLDSRGQDEWHRLTFGRGAWVEGQSHFHPRAPGVTLHPAAAASGVWKAYDTFELTIVQSETPFTSSVTFVFAGEQLRLHYRVNVNFGPTELPEMLGVRQSNKPA